MMYGHYEEYEDYESCGDTEQLRIWVVRYLAIIIPSHEDVQLSTWIQQLYLSISRAGGIPTACSTSRAGVHSAQLRVEVLSIHTAPATTRVAAWMMADTEVGPSMASGSHVWIPNITSLTDSIRMPSSSDTPTKTCRDIIAIIIPY